MATNFLAPITSFVEQVLVSQALAAGENTVYPVPSGSTVTLKGCVITNTSGSGVLISVSVVKALGAAGTANRVISSYTLAPGESYIANEVACHVLGSQDFISVFAGTAGVVAFVLSGIVKS